ncbi:unnamed protein product [Pleuronectes platessa]|uniref:Clathrin adaptor alpha/beta/gamma-adaptin appendage Ig-like subdomain domain-containing protein n=1 Tax=Pleuronectes platessa TaxID=8262 RepID=A0A9N7UMN3_PLEPL|nr:unnamed protein product [Pleuronectes platessa]
MGVDGSQRLGAALTPRFGVAYASGVNPASATPSEDPAPPLSEADELLNKFVCKNNGVLFENQLLQIGIKSEYRQNLGRMYLFYGNKTSVQFASFTTTVSCPGELQSHILSVSVYSETTKASNEKTGTH